MAEISAHLDLIASWVARQRWFGGKGRESALRSIGSFRLDGPADVALITHLIMDDAGSSPTLYQVPVSERRSPLPGRDAALIAESRDEHGALYLYDAPHDPDFAEALLRTIVAGNDGEPRGVEVRGVAFADAGANFTVHTSQVLSGEQSNTSIVYDVEGLTLGSRIICKMFRAIHHGDNPDVVLQSALAAAGSPHVPRSLGALHGEWNDVGRDDGRARGDLAFAQEFVSGCEDAWRYALRIADAGEDFTRQTHNLGVATAEVHACLASALPVRATQSSDIDDVITTWERRLRIAVAEVPVLREYEDLIRGLHQAARKLHWPSMQRIHGDYHLGQVLALPEGGWVVLDFEGEPMRPMIERSRLDFAERDVAGMLRSFDYVSGSLGGGAAVEEWAAASRQAFLDGYIQQSGTDLRAERTLLDAFETDKAVYEAIYESRNRPEWLPIPTAAVQRLVERVRAQIA